MFAKLKLRNLLMYFANLDFTTNQVAEINDRFRSSLLDYASETPDNVASVAKIEVGKVKVNGQVHSGLKIKEKNILLSEIMYAIEDMSLPAQVKDQLPQLTQEEWEAATRIIVFVLKSLEEEKSNNAI